MRLEIPEGPFEAYLFDCDGTLVDSMPLHYEAWNHGLRSAGAEWDLAEDYFYASAGKSLELVLGELNEHYSCALEPLEVARFKENYYHARMVALRSFPDTVAHLRDARERGIPAAVVSGSAREAVLGSLEATGLIDMLETVVTAEDVRRSKPAPDGFLLAAERLGVSPSRCLVFEDGISGLQAAEACGMATVFVDARRGVGGRISTGCGQED